MLVDHAPVLPAIPITVRVCAELNGVDHVAAVSIGTTALFAAMAGNNYRLTDLQTALCIPQLATYRNRIADRQEKVITMTSLRGDR